MPPEPSIAWACAKFEDLDTIQLHAIFAARQIVFVVEQACVYLDVDGRDPACWHLWGESAGDGLVAYARLLPPGVYFEEPSIGRVLTMMAARGQVPDTPWCGKPCVIASSFFRAIGECGSPPNSIWRRFMPSTVFGGWVTPMSRTASRISRCCGAELPAARLWLEAPATM